MSLQDVSCFAKDNSFTINVRSSDKTEPTSFWKAKRTSLPYLWVSNSGISDRYFSPFELIAGAPTPSCSRCWAKRWTMSASRKTAGPLPDLVVSTRYVTSSENACGWASSSGASPCYSLLMALRYDLSLLYRSVKHATWYLNPCAIASPPLSHARCFPSF